jgi:hypothetical protein
MALNPPLTNPSFAPLPVPGEFFILKRDGIDFTVDVEGVGKYQASGGTMYFTTLRMVFVASDAASKHGSSQFHGFDIPLANVEEEKFQQPIFGANYLEGRVRRWTVGPSTFRLTFRKGGVGTFLPLLIRLLDRHRRRQMARGGDFDSFVRSGGLTSGPHAAYVDPADPSVIFVSQPEPPQEDATEVTRAAVGMAAPGTYSSYVVVPM